MSNVRQKGNIVTIKSPSDFSAFDICSQVAAHLPLAENAEESINRILRFVQLIPSAIFSEHFILEYAPNINQFDISFCHANIQTTPFLPAILKQESTWKWAGEMMENICSTAFQQNHGDPIFWFEFDISSSHEWPPLPNAGFTNKKAIQHADLFAMIDLMGNDAIHKTVEGLLHHSTNFNLDIVHITFMKARAEDWVKLGFASKQLPDILECFLQKIGYVHSVAPLLPLIKMLEPFLKDIDLQIDIQESVRGKIGIECYAPHTDLGYHWIPVLDILADNLIISHIHKTALLSWIGETKHSNADQVLSCMRRIGYLKIVYEPGKPLSCKAYLGASLI